MSKNHRPPISKRKRQGQLSLVAAIVINGILLLLGLRISGLEGQLSEKMADERYFVGNQQAIGDEITKRTLLHTSLNQLKMLRRLARPRLTEDENKNLLKDETAFQVDITRSLRKIVGAAYLQATEKIPAGIDLDKMFSAMPDSQLTDMLPGFQEKSTAYIKQVKADQISLESRITFWKLVQSAGLILSTIVLIIGNVLIYSADGEVP